MGFERILAMRDPGFDCGSETLLKGLGFRGFGV